MKFTWSKQPDESHRLRRLQSVERHFLQICLRFPSPKRIYDNVSGLQDHKGKLYVHIGHFITDDEDKFYQHVFGLLWENEQESYGDVEISAKVGVFT